MKLSMEKLRTEEAMAAIVSEGDNKRLVYKKSLVFENMKFTVNPSSAWLFWSFLNYEEN